jgi:hypothetical protein
VVVRVRTTGVLDRPDEARPDRCPDEAEPADAPVDADLLARLLDLVGGPAPPGPVRVRAVESP